MRELLLARVAGTIVLFFDEIDAVRALPFTSDDFFAALRAVYNVRSDDAQYERLRICLLGVAQPGDLPPPRWPARSSKPRRPSASE